MSLAHLSPDELVVFHEEKVTRYTALNYIEEMDKAKTPYIVVERRNDQKYNVIAGFKYINGIRLLNKKTPLYCIIIDPFKSEKERKLAMLQRCISNNESIKYKELLVYELTHSFKMNEITISNELGQDANKIKKYMYQQVIPYTYYEQADKLGNKSLIQAIFLANGFNLQEKRVLTELCLEDNERLRFKTQHLVLYKKYRKTYPLFDDFTLAKMQIHRAVHIDNSIDDYWANIPNPFNYNLNNLTLDEYSLTN